MSIAFGRNNGNQIQRSKFMQGVSVYKSSAEPGFLIGSGQLEVEKQRKDNDDDGSSSSSSIGRNSDSSGGSSDGEDRDEVQSSCKGPLDTLDALEEVLPKKRGLSSFYNGKSKSFTSLGDTSSAASVKDLAKPDDPYTRKRKNLLAQSINCDNNQNPLIQSKGIGILKGPANYRQSTVHSSNSDCFDSISPSTSQNLPPLHPQGKKSSGKGPPSLPPPRRNSPWRSFSLSDLQCIAADETTSLAGMAYHGG